MPDFLTLDDISFRNKTVLLRADLNVPMDDGRVVDASRLERLMPTLQDLAKGDAKIAILSHFGRPQGKPDQKCSLRPVAAALEKIWGQKIAFAEDCIGPKAMAAVRALAAGQIVVLENTRFYPDEETNELAFAQQLAMLGEVYVNDAFSAAHRAHASTEGLAHLLPAAAGRLMQAEIEALTRALTKPERPLAALVGGSKISTKLALLENLIDKTDLLVLGGGMANTFLATQGTRIGRSICETNMFDTARAIMAKAEEKGCAILLPKDVVVARELAAGVVTQTVAIDAVPGDQMILDIGPLSVEEIRKSLDRCKTAVWNGPLGAFETPPFDRATNEVASYVADLTKHGKILSVAGGGDTVAALTHAGVQDDLSYLSAAGGAFLEWLEGKELPGVVALRSAAPKAQVERPTL